MPSPLTIDLEAVLVPVPGDNPAGESLRYADTYDIIKEARRADDMLDQGDWQRETKVADWPAVIRVARDALAKKSKDLQLAVWLVEALVKQHGFVGLRDGLRLLRELQEQFWEPLYPEIEDDDLEGRILVLEFLNRELPAAVRQVPITQGGEYSWLRWKESRDVDNLGRQNPEAQAAALTDGKITGEQFDKAVASTSQAYYEGLLEDMAELWQEYEQLDRVLDEKFGRDAPSLLDIKKAIEECRALVDTIARQRGITLDSHQDHGQEHDGGAGTDEAPAVENRPSGIVGGPLTLEPQNRADALRRLEAVANYFRKTEPHSPVAYLVERAVHWGNMPLESWLQDVIKDDGVLAYIRETLGLKNSEGSGE